MSVPSWFRARLLVLSAILVLAAIATQVAMGRDASTLRRKYMREFPKNIGGWIGRDQDMSNDVLTKLGVDDYVMRRYTRDGSVFWLYIGYYETQQGSKTIHSPKHCYPGSGWQKLDSSIQQVTVKGWDGADRRIPVNLYLLEKDGEKELVFYWYHTSDDVEASESRATFARFRGAVLRNRTNGALVRISTRFCGEKPDDVEQVRNVVPLVYSLLKDFIPE